MIANGLPLKADPDIEEAILKSGKMRGAAFRSRMILVGYHGATKTKVKIDRVSKDNVVRMVEAAMRILCGVE